MRPGPEILVQPVVEHVRNAPSRLMGIGATLMIIGLFLMMALVAENSSVLNYIGFIGVVMMLIGIITTGIGYTILERRWKKQGQ
ncbi:MAG: hypothetical protein V4690_04245 [Patescibacteria group bacterium]